MVKPILVWIRRDLRLTDHAPLAEAASHGAPVIPVFIADDHVIQLGAAPKWRFGLGIEAFRESLRSIGSDLVLRSGNALIQMEKLIRETGAEKVFWQRAYIPEQVERDKRIKAKLNAMGIKARSFPGHLLFEPWIVETKTGGFYKVFTPMWNTVRDREVGPPLPTVQNLKAPKSWPVSDDLADWQLGRAMNRGAVVVGRHVKVGEAAAGDRIDRFFDGPISKYKQDRDFPSIEATSRLSENLTYGEISPKQMWNAGKCALQAGAAGAETFLKELVWREFAYHLAWNTPHILTRNWKLDWDRFPWKTDGSQIERWQQGRTGEPFVDAAMRELYITGTMHNRARMIVASYLTKNLLTHWQVGQKWFEQCLVDWDPASNAMGWQWAAGCGPDAAPYFRVFNPSTQLEKFDKTGAYPAKFLAETSQASGETAASFFDAVPRSWDLSPKDKYPEPMISLADGRARALAAYQGQKTSMAGNSC